MNPIAHFDWSVALAMFWSFIKIGFFTIGGGYAMIPLIKREMTGNGWMSIVMVTDLIAISQITPGPFAVNAATFAGMQNAGIGGALLCTLGVTLPSLTLGLLVAKYFYQFQQHQVMRGLLWGIKPVVVGLIGASVCIVARSAILPNLGQGWNPLHWLGEMGPWGVFILAVCLFLLMKKKLNPAVVVCIAAAIGILLYFVRRPG